MVQSWPLPWHSIEPVPQSVSSGVLQSHHYTYLAHYHLAHKIDLRLVQYVLFWHSSLCNRHSWNNEASCTICTDWQMLKNFWIRLFWSILFRRMCLQFSVFPQPDATSTPSISRFALATQPGSGRQTGTTKLLYCASPESLTSAMSCTLLLFFTEKPSCGIIRSRSNSWIGGAQLRSLPVPVQSKSDSTSHSPGRTLPRLHILQNLCYRLTESDLDHFPTASEPYKTVSSRQNVPFVDQHSSAIESETLGFLVLEQCHPRVFIQCRQIALHDPIRKLSTTMRLVDFHRSTYEHFPCRWVAAEPGVQKLRFLWGFERVLQYSNIFGIILRWYAPTD